MSYFQRSQHFVCTTATQCCWWKALTWFFLGVGLVGLWSNTVGAGQQAPSTFFDRYNALLQRQVDLYFDETLSTLRKEGMYAQVWYSYKNAPFLYWQQEVSNFQQQQQQASTANPFKEIDSVLRIHLTKAMEELALSTSVVSEQIQADLERSDWSQRWKRALRTAASAFDQNLAQLKADFPDLQRYMELQQHVTQKMQAIYADRFVANTVTEQYEKLTQKNQRILRTIEYIQQNAALQEAVQQLWERHLNTNNDVRFIHNTIRSITNVLRETQYNVHAIIASCYGIQTLSMTRCVDYYYRQELQDFLPPATHLLQRLVEAQEEYQKELQKFLLSQRVQTLQQEVRAQIQPVAPDLRRAENTFLRALEADADTQELGQLLRQLRQVKQQLEAQ